MGLIVGLWLNNSRVIQARLNLTNVLMQIFVFFRIQPNDGEKYPQKKPYLCTVCAVKSKIDIRSLTLEELQRHIADMGEKAFRAKQIYAWLWQKSCVDFEEMSNLSKPLRDMLQETFTINAVTVRREQRSSDRTIKSKIGRAHV